MAMNIPSERKNSYVQMTPKLAIKLAINMHTEAIVIRNHGISDQTIISTPVAYSIKINGQASNAFNMPTNEWNNAICEKVVKPIILRMKT